MQLISLGEELFLERLKTAFRFEEEGTSLKIGGMVSLAQKLNKGNCVGRLIVAAQGHYPLYMTIRKL